MQYYINKKNYQNTGKFYIIRYVVKPYLRTFVIKYPSFSNAFEVFKEFRFNVEKNSQ